MSKVALITGGAKGLGLTVAKALARKGTWTFHIVDVNSDLGEKAASVLGNNSKFHKADVTSYKQMATVFDKAFEHQKRLDLVFNSAGIIDTQDFFAQNPSDEPPPELDQTVNNINYSATISTSYLAQHYFRKNTSEVKDMNLVLVASVAGLYSIPVFPLYVGSKHGVLGFSRSISKPSYLNDRVRVNAICPGAMPTDMLKQKMDISSLDPSMITSVSAVADVVTSLAAAEDLVDANGKKVSAENAWGLELEISGERLYMREQVEYCDKSMGGFIEAMGNNPYKN